MPKKKVAKKKAAKKAAPVQKRLGGMPPIGAR